MAITEIAVSFQDRVQCMNTKVALRLVLYARPGSYMDLAIV